MAKPNALPNDACDSKLLEALVSDQFTGTITSEIEIHVGSCPACQQALLSHAGGEEFEGEVRENLPLRPWQLRPQQLHAPSELSLSFLKPSPDPRFLGLLGRYAVESVLGQGGCGVVLKGWDADLGRYVAIKVMATPLLHSGVARQRLIREAHAAAAISHDAVVPIHSVEYEGDLPYLVLGYVSGPSLERYLQQHGSLEPTRAVAIALQIASGLAAAHARGIVHRDIKPGNILLDGELDRIKITDFGLARVIDDASQTQSGMILGTPQYMSPEQAAGVSIDERSDLFSLGCVLYAMLCGHSPFRAESTLGVLRRICDDEPRDLREINPNVQSELAAIVLGLLRKKPEERLGSANELVGILQGYLAYLQQPLTHPLTAELKQRLRSFCDKATEKQPRRFSTSYLRFILPLLGLTAALAIAAPFISGPASRYLQSLSGAQAEGAGGSREPTPQTQNNLPENFPRVAESTTDPQISSSQWHREVSSISNRLDALERELASEDSTGPSSSSANASEGDVAPTTPRD